MGSNPVNLVQEDLCCPVCKKPLSSPGTPPKPKLHKLGRGKGRAPHLHNSFQAQRDTRMAIGKFKDNEEIVIAQCGHLFHKFCLRHYCYLVREGRSNHMHKVTCPCCDRAISMSSQTVDYRAHQDKPNDRDKDFTKTSIMHNELSGQMLSVQHKLQQVESAIEDGNHNFDIYRSHWRKLRKELKNIKGKRHDIENMYSEIERSEQMLKCMQNQQLKIVKKFIAKVKEKSPKDYIHFPRRLSPFLTIIEEDDRLVRDLGEIIVPIHLNHLKSDRQSLLKGIIATVHERLVAQGKIREVPIVATPESQSQRVPGEPPKKPAIFVKVRKSSISILSSASLTRESIQQIIENVNVPLHRSRTNNSSAAKTQKGELTEKASKADDASTSDIKVLFMPRRKMVEQTSEPCRTIEENESYTKVPARKCKSTDAILVKTKKTKETPKCHNINDLARKSKIDEKRSSTAGVVKVRSLRESNRSPIKNELPLLTTNATDQVDESGKIKLEEVKEANASDKKFVTNPESKTAPEAKNIVSTPTETTSLLKLIYDNLEEERKSTQDLEIRRKTTLWTDFDENNNKPEQVIAGKGLLSQSKNCASNQSQEARAPPQFFRVDGRGIARPESPHSIQFREPTFLSCPLDPNISDKFLTSSIFQPDEENQLSVLSAEEKYKILSEHEAFLSSRRNCTDSLRRPIFHGTPACLGMVDRHSDFGTPPSPHHVPFYLKKWQQQLSSRKVLKAIPRRLANASIRSTRLLNSPKNDRTSCFNSAYAHSQPISSYQREEGTENFSQSRGIHLPPLSMYPAKRPTTAQCDNCLSHNQHREGPEHEISRIYNYDSVWK